MIYVMSDIHGHEDRFNSIMKQINLQSDDTLYILGDVIDRNKNGIRILRKLMAMPNVKMLLGNHELMMLEAIQSLKDNPKDRYSYEMRLWYNNGGYVTHNYLKHIKRSIREEIYSFLGKLPVNLEVTVNGVCYKLCHASPIENWSKSALNSLKYDTKDKYAVWKRRTSADGVPQGFSLIFGHTPTCNLQKGYPWRIFKGKKAFGIDCGCGYDEGRLLCLRLDDMKEFYSEYTWNDIFKNAVNKAFLSPELKAKDEARYQLGELIKKEAGYDIEACESAETEIDKYLRERKATVLFDERGNILQS